MATLAKDLALTLHAGQRYGKLPYAAHLSDVVGILEEMVPPPHLSQDLIDAAWLHDALEDTSVSAEAILEASSPETLAIVQALTNTDEGPNYQALAEVEGAALVKLADRLANVRRCYKGDLVDPKHHRKFLKYRGQHDKLTALYSCEYGRKITSELARLLFPAS